ncbi:hypothetical protein P6F26_11245 [Roseibacterium sp. SDUM158017]|uniref:hypothetical protein n=1 Tax=Roseicyclus salinarum TaxID=3036773 RepID=UPI0024157393|nr:hypothetical protein [Roseibacterium sp. SDUM158017]MDG4649020.1 hypothetical protein [Roseibacterium sp. SDUM158017]
MTTDASGAARLARGITALATVAVLSACGVDGEPEAPTRMGATPAAVLPGQADEARSATFFARLPKAG